MEQDRVKPEAEVDNSSRTRAKIEELKEKLARQEAKEHGGAPSRSLHETLIDATALEDADPAHHYRYVGTLDPQKVEARKRQGYTTVDSKEAEAHNVSARHDGVDVLMKQPKELHEKRKREIREATDARQSADRAEFERTVEGVAKVLRDKHGIKVDTRRLLVDERE